MFWGSFVFSFPACIQTEFPLKQFLPAAFYPSSKQPWEYFLPSIFSIKPCRDVERLTDPLLGFSSLSWTNSTLQTFLHITFPSLNHLGAPYKAPSSFWVSASNWGGSTIFQVWPNECQMGWNNHIPLVLTTQDTVCCPHAAKAHSQLTLCWLSTGDGPPGPSQPTCTPARQIPACSTAAWVSSVPGAGLNCVKIHVIVCFTS